MKREILKTLYRQCKQALINEQFQEATELLIQLKAEAPLALEIRGIELDLLTRQGRFDEAQPLAKQLISQYPQSAKIHFLHAQLYYRQKNYQQAILSFTESHCLFPHWKSERWLAKTYTQTGDFDRAEAILIKWADDRLICYSDLAWLYERKGEIERAITCLEKYLATQPNKNNTHSQQQLTRLKAKKLDFNQLQEEITSLLEFDEAIPGELIPRYIQAALESGQGDKARSFITSHSDSWDIAVKTQCGWTAHEQKAFDLTWMFFIDTLTDNTNSNKFLNVLENAAKKCNRVEDLVGSYQQLAPSQNKFYGRIKRIEKYVK